MPRAATIEEGISTPASHFELSDELEALVRGTGHEVTSYLESIATETVIDGTKLCIQWHRLAHHVPTDRPQIDKLVTKLIGQLVDFSRPRSDIEVAVNHCKATGSAEKLSLLQEKARRLFTSLPKTGEVGELLLYLLAERLLRYPQVLCKFPHKTNSEMHAHGADGIHASVNPHNGHLRLHWGEAKLYAQLWNALDDCFSSLRDLLLSPPEAEKTKERDVELLRDFVDLKDAALEEALKAYLDDDNQLSNHVEYCGLALVGFNLEDYADFSSEVIARDTAKTGARIKNWIKSINNSVTKHELTGFTIDVFCIPFASVDALRDKFLERMGLKNGSK